MLLTFVFDVFVGSIKKCFKADKVARTKSAGGRPGTPGNKQAKALSNQPTMPRTFKVKAVKAKKASKRKSKTTAKPDTELTEEASGAEGDSSDDGFEELTAEDVANAKMGGGGEPTVTDLFGLDSNDEEAASDDDDTKSSSQAMAKQRASDRLTSGKSTAKSPLAKPLRRSESMNSTASHDSALSNGAASARSTPPPAKSGRKAGTECVSLLILELICFDLFCRFLV